MKSVVLFELNYLKYGPHKQSFNLYLVVLKEKKIFGGSNNTFSYIVMLLLSQVQHSWMGSLIELMHIKSLVT